MLGWMQKDSLIGCSGGYNELRKVSSGLSAVLLDNCGGHGDLPSFDGVEYVELPPNTTADSSRWIRVSYLSLK